MLSNTARTLAYIVVVLMVAESTPKPSVSQHHYHQGRRHYYHQLTTPHHTTAHHITHHPTRPREQRTRAKKVPTVALSSASLGLFVCNILLWWLLWGIVGQACRCALLLCRPKVAARTRESCCACSGSECMMYVDVPSLVLHLAPGSGTAADCPHNKAHMHDVNVLIRSCGTRYLTALTVRRTW